MGYSTKKANNSLGKRVIIITGTPGVGKTVVSKAIAIRLGATYVSLTEIAKEEKLVLGVDEERRTLIVDIKKISKLVKEIILRSQIDIVIDGHYASDVVPSKLVSQIFVLRRDPEELKAEFETRGYDDRKIAENVTSEVLDVCLVDAVEKYGIEKVDEIDVTKKRTEDVIEEILEIINGQIKPRLETVDWLSKLDKDGRLDKILPLLSKT
jgi:adenylate kinase